MPRNIIKISYLGKIQSPKTAEMAEKGRFVGPRGPNCRNGKKWCVFLALGGRILTLFSRYLSNDL